MPSIDDLTQKAHDNGMYLDLGVLTRRTPAGYEYEYMHILVRRASDDTVVAEAEAASIKRAAVRLLDNPKIKRLPL